MKRRSTILITLVVIGTFALHHPETYFTLNKLFFGPSHTIPLLSLSPSIILREIDYTIRTIVVSSSFMIPLIVISITGMIIKRIQEMKIWFIITISLTTAFILLLHNKFVYYIIFY